MNVTEINKNNANLWQVTVLDPLNNLLLDIIVDQFRYAFCLKQKMFQAIEKAVTDDTLIFRTSKDYTEYLLGESPELVDQLR